MPELLNRSEGIARDRRFEDPTVLVEELKPQAVPERPDNESYPDAKEQVESLELLHHDSSRAKKISETPRLPPSRRSWMTIGMTIWI